MLDVIVLSNNGYNLIFKVGTAVPDPYAHGREFLKPSGKGSVDEFGIGVRSGGDPYVAALVVPDHKGVLFTRLTWPYREVIKVNYFVRASGVQCWIERPRDSVTGFGHN